MTNSFKIIDNSFPSLCHARVDLAQVSTQFKQGKHNTIQVQLTSAELISFFWMIFPI